jgi:hypothetical protein
LTRAILHSLSLARNYPRKRDLFAIINADIGALTFLLLKLVTETARELRTFAAALVNESVAPIE